jgi:hypothetical protein
MIPCSLHPALTSHLAHGRVSSLIFTLCLGSLAVGCSGDDDPGSPAPSGEPTIVLADANNYTSTSSLEAVPTETVAAGVDLEICFDQVVADLQCHEVSPVADLDNIAITRFEGKSVDDVKAMVVAGEVTSAGTQYFERKLGHDTDCVNLSEFKFSKNLVPADDFVETDTDTYLVIVTEGITPAVGTRSMKFVAPSSASDVDRLDLATGCGLLEFTADLRDPVAAPKGGPWIADWRGVTLDGQGNPFAPARVDKVLVGFYEGLSETDVEAQIFDLETLPGDEHLWETAISSKRQVDLKSLRRKSDGQRFAGFDVGADGTWLLALLCTGCQNPQPLLLTILEPSGG